MFIFKRYILTLATKKLTFDSGLRPHLVTDAEKIIVEEFKELGFFKFDLRNDFV